MHPRAILEELPDPAPKCTPTRPRPATPPGGAEQVLNQIVTGQSGLTQDTRLLSCLAGLSAQCCEAIVEYFGAAADFSGCQVGARSPGR